MEQRKIYSAQELGKFLRENSISPTEAINIIKKYKFNRIKGTAEPPGNSGNLHFIYGYVIRSNKKVNLETELTLLKHWYNQTNTKGYTTHFPTPSLTSREK